MFYYHYTAMEINTCYLVLMKVDLYCRVEDNPTVRPAEPGENTEWDREHALRKTCTPSNCHSVALYTDTAV